MQVTLTFKTPDVVDDAVNEIEDEAEREKAREVCAKFVRYGEYITVTVDTDTGIAEVNEV